MKNWSLKKLVNVAAEICDYALDHYDTGDGTCKAKTPWPEDSPNHSLAWEALGASSYTLTCIAAQHTPGGRGGVETEAPFYALQMWEFMSMKKRRRLAKAFFMELGAQKQFAKKPHQPLAAACTPVPPPAGGSQKCQTCDIHLDGNEPDEVAVGDQCLHCSSADAPPAAPRPCSAEYVATDPKGLLGNIKTLESACPKCMGPMEFEIGVSIRMDTNPEVVSIDTDGCRGVNYWWCEACGTHEDPLQLDALAEARADVEAKWETCETVTPEDETERAFCDMDSEDLQREVEKITETYGLWVREAVGYKTDRRDELHQSMARAMSHRMDLAFCDRRHTPRVGDKVITLNGDNDHDEEEGPRRALPGDTGKVVDVDDGRCSVIFDKSGVWVVLELYEICDPEQYTWEP